MAGWVASNVIVKVIAKEEVLDSLMETGTENQSFCVLRK